MTDDLENYIHMKKPKYIDNGKKVNFIDNKTTKQKLIFEADKLKNDSKESDNISQNSINKMNINNSNNIYCKKRANSFYDNEKPIIPNNDINLPKKLINNKSYNNNERRDNYDRPNNNINNKIVKKSINNSRNQKIMYNKSPSNKYGNKMKLRKKIIYKMKNNDSKNKTCINDIDITKLNEKHNKTYFNTLFNSSGSINRNIEKKNFSYSQNLENKDNNNFKKVNIINIDLSSKHNEDIKTKFITEAEKEFNFNNSNKNFYIKKSKNPFHPKNKIINSNIDYSNYTKYEDIINNYQTKYDNCSIINISQKKLQQPIKIYNDNTTINLADSYNFNQYFHTINSNNNNNNNNNMNYNNYNSSSKKTKIYSNYRYNFSPSYSPMTHANNKNKYKSKYYHTQLNSNENSKKSNNIVNNSNKYLNRLNKLNKPNSNKLIEEINVLQEEMNKNLNLNPSNSKSKKYNTLKNFFEKLLKVINNYFFNNDLNVLFNFLQKLLIGYHEVVLAFSSENRKLKELNYKLTEQYQKIDKNLIECNKSIKEKQKRIEVLENKIYTLVNNMRNKNNIIINNKSKEINLYRSINFSSINNKNKSKLQEYPKYSDEIEVKKSEDKQNNKIKKINEKNLDDLDALYFFDKIEMKPQRSFSGGKKIPFLPINIKKNNNI